jgi:hypothetical protein
MSLPVAAHELAARLKRSLLPPQIAGTCGATV